MKYEETIRSLQERYIESIIRIGAEIIKMLKENGGKIETEYEDCEALVDRIYN